MRSIKVSDHMVERPVTIFARSVAAGPLPRSELLRLMLLPMRSKLNQRRELRLLSERQRR